MSVWLSSETKPSVATSARQATTAVVGRELQFFMLDYYLELRKKHNQDPLGLGSVAEDPLRTGVERIISEPVNKMVSGYLSQQEANSITGEQWFLAQVMAEEQNDWLRPMSRGNADQRIFPQELISRLEHKPDSSVGAVLLAMCDNNFGGFDQVTNRRSIQGTEKYLKQKGITIDELRRLKEGMILAVGQICSNKQ